MKPKLRIVLYFMLVSILFAACSGPAQTADGETNTDAGVTDLESFLAKLEAEGIASETGDQINQPFFEVPGQVVSLDGYDVQVFEFEDETASTSAAESIAPDGGSVGTSMMSWIDTPHFYRSGKLIVLYLGNDADALGVLEGLLGPQIAGG